IFSTMIRKTYRFTHRFSPPLTNYPFLSLIQNRDPDLGKVFQLLLLIFQKHPPLVEADCSKLFDCGLIVVTQARIARQTLKTFRNC
ncbi:MAG: hypothetical protein ABEJ03_02070, partial [Candidatus Nanohaloarchaea archaeon]